MKEIKKIQKPNQENDQASTILNKNDNSGQKTPLQRSQISNQQQNSKRLTQKDKLALQKRELQVKLEQKKFKYNKNEKQKEQFRNILFKNFMEHMKNGGSGKKGKRAGKSPLKNSLKEESKSSSNNFGHGEIPTNLNNLYFDAIEEKIFTQIKIDLFSAAIRKNMENFSKIRKEYKCKIEGKQAALKIMEDLNQNLKRKYIKKNLDYKKICRGEPVQEPMNFFQQMVFDLKKDLNDKKKIMEKPQQQIEILDQQAIISIEDQKYENNVLSPPVIHSPTSVNHQENTENTNEQGLLTHEEQMEHTRQFSETKAKMQQQIRQLKHMELEVKTISEKSQEDSVEVSMSLNSSKVTTPMHHKNYLSSGGIQRKLQTELGEINESGIAHDNPITDFNNRHDGLPKKQIQILELLNEICEDADEHRNEDEYDKQQLSHEEVEAETEKEENKIIEQIMKVLQVKDSDTEYQSITYTDGIYLQNINGDQLEIVIKYLYHIDEPKKYADFKIPDQFDILMELFETVEYLGLDGMKAEVIPDLLAFILCDPALEQLNQIDNFKNIFHNFYASFLKERNEYMERMKNDDSFRFVFDEDLQYLPQEYYDVYNDSVECLSMKDVIAQHVVEALQHLRSEFKNLPFDFHSCFFFNTQTNSFQIHRQYLQQEDVQPEQPFIGFKRPFILFSAINANAFANCLTELFGLSKRFSQIRILNLRGLISLHKEQVLNIIQNCSQVCHLNLSFVKAVDDEVIDKLGSKYSKTLISLELRACQNITDKGIINLCEGLSGIKDMRNGEEPADDYQRYKPFNRYDACGKLKHLNLADLKQITWGCYKITNEGFLELCTASRSENFRRLNYCGCYKISDDSRLWLSTSFTRVLIYNKVDDFGKELDYNEIIELEKESSKNEENKKQN